MADKTRNLIPFNKMSKERHRELASRGGVNAAKSRKKKKATKELVDALLSSTVTNKQLKEQLINFGIDKNDLTNQMALVLKTYTLAMNGNMAALQLLLTGFELSELDKENIKLKKKNIKLQEEKLSLEKERNELLNKQLNQNNDPNNNHKVVIVNDLDAFNDEIKE